MRDSSGEPTGVFRETAAMSSVGDAFPPSDEQVAGWLVAAQDACLAVGLTEIHDPGHHTLPERDLPALRDLADKGHLKLRVRHMIRIPELESHSWPSHAPSPFLSDMLTARCIKLFADGSLGNRGAALLAPYRDEPSQRGSLLLDEDDLAWALNESANRGFQVAVHAIGDRANRLVLDTVQHVRATNPGAAERLRIEHAQVLSREDIARFAALGAIASIQPVHAVEDKDFAEERLGGRRLRGAYAWRKLIRAGARIACGSDYPYGASEYRPLVGIHAAVTRQRPDRDPPRGWRPHEKMTLEEAVRGFSVGPAYAAFEERTRGVIASGRWADLTVLDRDPFGVTDPRILLKAQVRMTIVGGQVVYEPTT